MDNIVSGMLSKNMDGVTINVAIHRTIPRTGFKGARYTIFGSLNMDFHMFVKVLHTREGIISIKNSTRAIAIPSCIVVMTIDMFPK